MHLLAASAASTAVSTAVAMAAAAAAAALARLPLLPPSPSSLLPSSRHAADFAADAVCCFC